MEWSEHVKYGRPADDVVILGPGDLPFDSRARTVLVVEAGSGTLAVRVQRDKRGLGHTERVLTVTEGERLRLGTATVLAATTIEVDGYAAGTPTQPTRLRALIWRDG